MNRIRFVQWKEEYSVGVDWLDEQHRRMLAIINILNEDLQDGRARETIREIAAEIRRYTKTHFEDEERFMRESGYPGYEEHRQSHIKMLDWTADLTCPLPEGNYDDGRNALNYLMHWWVSHIRKSDRDFASYLNRAKVQKSS